MDDEILRGLRNRVGDDYLQARLRAQANRNLFHFRGHGKGEWHLENVPSILGTFALFLKMTGLHQIGTRNALQFKITHTTFELPGLPAPLDGLRVLHLTDLHLDGHDGLGGKIGSALKNEQFDLVLLTGDYPFHGLSRSDQMIHEMASLRPYLDCKLGVYGILGNHDFIEHVPLLENLGIRVLLNESVALQNGSADLWLAGVDDPHFYGMHDLRRATRPIPPDATVILMAHSPEIIPEAAASGVDLYLSGHTHGGQICLPGGYALLLNAKCKRKYASGKWRFRQMQGYTSDGTGSSGLFVRFFCPPEIAIHTLHCESKHHKRR
ncbi:MAG: metallophosphoesterase [Anaerolineaceae bacterium]|nr:metallophosphoesterase [Anaerolineaceae bacterium]